MPDQEGIVPAGVYIFTATADFIHHKLVNVNDPPSDDCCAICHQRYRTPDEYGTTPENAVRFPCGHEVGDVCFDIWFHASEQQQLRCLYCHKSVVPARYLWEQVNEIWNIVSEVSPKDIHNELSNTTARGPLSRAIEPLRRYVMVEAPSMPPLGETPRMPLVKDANEDLVPNFEWLLMATSDFLSAVQIYAETSVATNTHRINFEALKRRVCEFDLSYASFQSVIMDMVVKNIDQVEIVDQVKNADHGGREDDANQGGREDDADQGGREDDADQGGREDDADQGEREDDAERLSFAAAAFSGMLKTLWAVVLLALLLVVLLVLWTVLLNWYVENLGLMPGLPL